MQKTTRINGQRTVSSLVVGVVLLDQFSKYVVATEGGIVVINQGISFGWRPAGEWLTIGLLAVVGLLLILAQRYWRRAPNTSGLFFGGVFSNLLDRFFFGGVRDWLPLPGLGLYNNLADWAIAMAVILLIYQALRTDSAGESVIKTDEKTGTV